MNFAVLAVAAALVAAVSVLAFLALRTIGILKTLRAGLDDFRREAEPLVREVAALSEEAATRAQGLLGGLAAVKGHKP